MPELPEVETIVRDLKEILPGQKFVGLETIVPKTVLPNPAYFSELTNKKVLHISRHGKFISIEFEDDFIMTIHLRMTGQLIFKNKSTPALKFERTRIDFDKKSLRFLDIRKFGRVWLCKKDCFKNETGICKLGIDPFSLEYTFENFQKIFSKKTGNIKKNLLDQSLISGIGNIFADEILFDAKISPKANTQKLSKEKLKILFISIKKILEQGIKNRGTSISDFVDTKGNKGNNQNYLKVYGKGKEKCFVCNNALSKEKIAGRGTAWCEVCQKV